jgi:hypothetical protein
MRSWSAPMMTPASSVVRRFPVRSRGSVDHDLFTRARPGGRGAVGTDHLRLAGIKALIGTFQDADVPAQRAPPQPRGTYISATMSSGVRLRSPHAPIAGSELPERLKRR